MQIEIPQATARMLKNNVGTIACWPLIPGTNVAESLEVKLVEISNIVLNKSGYLPGFLVTTNKFYELLKKMPGFTYENAVPRLKVAGNSLLIMIADFEHPGTIVLAARDPYLLPVESKFYVSLLVADSLDEMEKLISA